MKFTRAFSFIMKMEGGYVNDPHDPGGETKYGISKRSYPHLDIKNLGIMQAYAIYREDYWDAADCDNKPLDVRLAIFDCAVNQGVGAALSLWRKVQSRGESRLEYYMAERMLRYARLKTFKRYGRGWSRRCFEVMRETLEWQCKGK